MTKTQKLFSKITNFEPTENNPHLELDFNEVELLKELLSIYV